MRGFKRYSILFFSVLFLILALTSQLLADVPSVTDYVDDKDLYPIQDEMLDAVVSIYEETPRPDNSVQPICTGTLISPHLVLTALHCIASFDVGPENLFIISGPTNRRQKIRAKRFITKDLPFSPDETLSRAYHQKNSDQGMIAGYLKMATIDIGLIVLEKPLRNVIPIELLPSSFTKNDLMNFKYFTPSYPKRSQSYGWDSYKNLTAQLNICVILEMTETDQTLMTDCLVSEGSSGGPLLVKIQHFPFIVGVASSALTRHSYSESVNYLGLNDFESYFTNLHESESRAWIEKVIEQIENR